MDGQSEARIGALFGLSQTGVFRHRNHVDALIAQVEDLPAVADSLLARVKRLIGRLETLAEDAHGAKAGAALLQVADRLAKFYDLLGRITGEIQPVQVQQFFLGLGVNGQAEAEAIIARHKELDSYSLDDAERDAIETLRLVLEQHPERADRIRSEILGERRVELAQEATVE